MLIFQKVGMCRPDFSRFSFDQVKAPEKRERGAAVKGEGRLSETSGSIYPPKTNMEPKLTWNLRHGGLEDDFPFQTGDVQVPAVSFQGMYLV